MPNTQHEAIPMLPIEFQFSKQMQTLHVEMRNNEPLFLAKDVCDALELENVTKALYSLDEDEKLTLPVVRAGQTREMNFVNESGLYNLIFQSRKPEAKRFRKWVTSEVLPSIRKTGSYGKIAQTFLSSPQSFNDMLQYCDSREHEGDVYYAANTLREMAGKNKRPILPLLNKMNLKGEALKLEEDNQTRWYVRRDAIWKYLIIKPVSLVNISIIKMLKEGGQS